MTMLEDVKEAIEATENIRRLVRVREELNLVMRDLKVARRFRACDRIRNFKKAVSRQIEIEADALDEMQGGGSR